MQLNGGRPTRITGPRRPTRPGGRLTRRQIEILTHAANGRTSPQIAVRLGITPATVQEALHRIYKKLGARNCAHATATALILELIDPIDIDIAPELKDTA